MLDQTKMRDYGFLLSLSLLVLYGSTFIHLGCSSGGNEPNPVTSCLEKVYPSAGQIPADDLPQLKSCCEDFDPSKINRTDLESRITSLESTGASAATIGVLRSYLSQTKPMPYGKFRDDVLASIPSLCRCVPTRCPAIGNIERVAMLAANVDAALNVADQETHGNGAILSNELSAPPSPVPFTDFVGFDPKSASRETVALTATGDSLMNQQEGSNPFGPNQSRMKSGGGSGALTSGSSLFPSMDFSGKSTTPNPGFTGAIGAAADSFSSGPAYLASGGVSEKKGNSGANRLGAVVKGGLVKEMSFGGEAADSALRQGRVSPDPEDYFDRIDRSANLFELIHIRYQAVAKRQSLSATE